MKISTVNIVPLSFLLALCACQQPVVPVGRDTISAADLHEKIMVLASDEFAGRAPSSPGETKTINYLKDQLAQYGVAPGNGDSYFQEVPLVDITATEMSPLVIEGGDNTLEFSIAIDMVALTRRVVDGIDVARSPVVFVGYGIVAPEYGWDDYAGIDMHGKTALILINDPGYATQDPDLFDGDSMTYYGRWTYKYEEAMRQGADAAIIIHETGAAAYPWVVVKNGWTGRNFYSETEDGNLSRTKVEGWVSTDAAKAIFTEAHEDYEGSLAAAAKAGFKPVELSVTASVSFRITIGRSRSSNVIGILRGSETPDEYFIYMAHWDHFGIGDAENGDDIYNGAVDNGTGTAAVLELAQAFASLPVKPKRSVIFLFPTAEEQGLLGSEYYATHPVYPLNRTVAGLNIDAYYIVGPTRDVTIIGYGMSELDAILKAKTESMARTIAPDANPAKGFYFRSDHFPLAKRGVPMIYPKNGIDHVKFGVERGREVSDAYVANTYHKPSDEYHADWDLSGMVQDLMLYFDVGNEVANNGSWPNWKVGSQFRTARDESMATVMEENHDE